MADFPSDALLHPHWYRVAPLKPRLRGHVRLQRQTTRGERWMLLTDGVSQRTHRLLWQNITPAILADIEAQMYTHAREQMALYLDGR